MPGYAAPETTIPAAARTGMVLIGIFRDARQGVGLDELPLSAELRPEAARLAAEIAPDLPRRWPPPWSRPGRSCSGW